MVVRSSHGLPDGDGFFMQVGLLGIVGTRREPNVDGFRDLLERKSRRIFVVSTIIDIVVDVADGNFVAVM